jgi:protein-tyrosine-phosphatase
MPGPSKSTKSKGGRAKARMAKRLANRTTQKHKIIRVFKSCGLKEAEKFGVEFGVLKTLRDYQAKHPEKKHDRPAPHQAGV